MKRASMIRSAVQMGSVFTLALLATVVAGCGDSNPPPKTANTPLMSNMKDDGKAKPNDNGGVRTSSLSVSDEIARLCGLKQSSNAPNFAYDSSQIADDDRAMLTAIAKCLTEGALKGRNISLIGRADQRGEPEYNMSLGENRSDAVRRYMHDLGVQENRMKATSRGELDATGKDEAGFAKDRRVDIALAN